MTIRFLVLSASLRPQSLSRVLAEHAYSCLRESGVEVEWMDLRDWDLPSCDASDCYSHPKVVEIKERLISVDGYLVASPIYNYDVSSAFKNVVELTGKDVWSDKGVGFLAAAGGQGSYMSLCGITNSLMLDFRTLVLPRFVFANNADFDDWAISNPEIQTRLEELSTELVRVTSALRPR